MLYRKNQHFPVWATRAVIYSSYHIIPATEAFIPRRASRYIRISVHQLFRTKIQIKSDRYKNFIAILSKMF